MTLAGRPIRVVKTVPVRAGLVRWGAVLDGHRSTLGDLDVDVTFAEVPGVELDEIEDAAHAEAVAAAHAAFVRRLVDDDHPPDAIALGCLLEPGLDDLVDLALPITGEIEASIRLLATPARPVGLVAGCSGAVEAACARIAHHGLDRLVAEVCAIDAAPLRFTEPDAEAELAAAMITEVLRMAKRGVSQIIGYGSASLLHDITQRTGVSVHSPVTASIRATVASVGARAAVHRPPGSPRRNAAGG